MSATKKRCGAEARKMAKKIAAEHGFTLAELGTPSRKAKLCYARGAIMHTLYATGLYSFQAVGELVNRDPWSAQYSVRRFPEMQPPSGKRKARKNKPAPRTNAHKAAARAKNMLRQRLLFRYGPERTAAILAGNDPATNADVAKWNDLGRAHERRAGL